MKHETGFELRVDTQMDFKTRILAPSVLTRGTFKERYKYVFNKCQNLGFDKNQSKLIAIVSISGWMDNDVLKYALDMIHEEGESDETD